MNTKTVKSIIRDAGQSDDWTIGNDALYSLCKEYPNHTNNAEIVSKIWLIGRSYSAAVERRKAKTSKITNEDFYTKKIAPSIKRSNIHKYLNKIKKVKQISEKDIPDILKVHNAMVSALSQHTKQENISLSSKYLHFHRPHLYFLYDGRARQAISKLIKGCKLDIKGKVKKINILGDGSIYGSFFCKCYILNRVLCEKFNCRIMTPREFDTFLLIIYSRYCKKKRMNK